MPKNMLPMKTGGSMATVLKWLIGLAVLALLIKHPAEAASVMDNAFRRLGDAVDGISTFLRSMLT